MKMHFVKGTRTFVCLFIGILAAVPTLTSAEAINCLQCSSSKDNNCIDATINATPCEDVANMKCFTKSDGGVITRGCLKPDDTTTCTGNCKSGSDNKHRICKKCTKDDAKCSTSDASDSAYNDVCDAADTECIVTVTDKKVERRCATAQDACSNENTCKKCSGSNCNAGIFPSNRIRCYQCSGSDCGDVASKAGLSTPCNNYVDKDACYMLADSDTSVKRGCKSDDSSPCSAGTEAGCATCDKDNCNNSLYQKNQALKCIQCSGTDCFKAQQDSDAKDCTQKILYNATESCYTLVKNGNIQRGCLHDDAQIANECGTANSSCKVCSNANGCNKDAEPNVFTCIVCRSDVEPKCWNNAKELTGTKCRTGESNKEEGCFHGIWYGVAIRGCTIDADIQTQVICKDKDNNQCHICNEANCNNQKSSAATKSVTIGLLAIMIVAISYLK